jgi:hypothetical protein
MDSQKNIDSQKPDFGFNAFAEKWNGRLAMIGFASALINEYVTGHGILSQLGFM